MSPRESHALPACQGIVYISVLTYILFCRPATNIDLIAFFPPRIRNYDSKSTNKKHRQKYFCFFTHSYIRKSDFSVWFLRYFWTIHPIKLVLAGFVTVVHMIIFYSFPYAITKYVNTNCWVIIIAVFMNISFIIKLAFYFVQWSPSEEAGIYWFIYLWLYSRNP